MRAPFNVGLGVHLIRASHQWALDPIPLEIRSKLRLIPHAR